VGAGDLDYGARGSLVLVAQTEAGERRWRETARLVGCRVGTAIRLNEAPARIGAQVAADAFLLDVERAMQDMRKRAVWLNDAEWIEVIQRTHRKVAVPLGLRWELPDAVLRTVRDCEEYDNADRVSASNIVRFANALVKQEGIYVGNVNKDDNDALVMIGMSLLGLDEAAVKRGTVGLAAVRKQTP